MNHNNKPWHRRQRVFTLVKKLLSRLAILVIMMRVVNISSEAESYSISDKENAELLQMALEGAYTCSPCKAMIDPAERSSYLLFDKDLMSEDDDEIGKLHSRIVVYCVM